MDFRPTMSFGLFHDGNIAVVGGAQGDEAAALSFNLAWDRKTPTTTFAVSYRPTAVFYRESSDLNYFGNALVVDFSKESSNESRVKVGAYVERTQYQGQTAETAARAKTFVPRSTQFLAAVTVDGTVPAGRRGLVDWQVRTGLDRYTGVPVDPTTTAPAAVEFNDGNWAAGNAAWRKEVSARNTLGFGVGVGYFGYETTPNVVVASLGVVGTSQTGPLWTLNYVLGASRASSDSGSDDGFSFDVTMDYAAGRASTFRAGARQSYSPGTGLGGATQDLGAWVSYASTRTSKGLFGSVLGGYWLRDSLQGVSATTEGDTATLNVRGSLGWEFNRYISLEGAYAFVDQSGTNGAAPGLDTTYSSYGVYLRWAIRGR